MRFHDEPETRFWLQIFGYKQERVFRARKHAPGHEDQVVLLHDQVLVLMTRSWSGSPKRNPYC